MNIEDLKAKVKELQGLEKKTTSGPWIVSRTDHQDGENAEFLYIKTPLGDSEYCPMWECELKGSPAHIRAVNDISFVTDLRTTAPQLLQVFLLMAEVVEAANAHPNKPDLYNALKALDEHLNGQSS